MTTQTTSEPAQGAEAPVVQNFFTIPFSYDPPARPLIVIELSINKSERLRFLVDTGWGPTLSVLPTVAKKIGLPTTNEEARFQPGNILVRYTQVCNVEIFTQAGQSAIFQVEKAVVGDIPFLKSYSDQHIDGILGGELFKTLISRFDFDTKTLTLFHASYPAIIAPSSATVLPLYNKAASIVPHVQLTPAGIGLTDFVVDTGSNSTAIPDNLSAKLQIVASTAILFNNAAEARQVQEVLVPTLALGNHSESLTALIVEPAAMLPPATQGLLGLDVLSRFRVTLDPKGGNLILEPRANYKYRLAGDSGFQVVLRRDNLYIDKVTSPSLSKQGIATGDRIVSVDGQEVKGMNLMEALYKLYGREGDLLTLEVEKADHAKRTLKWMRPSLFPSLVRTTLGLTLTKEAASAARIVLVEAGTGAERAGIEVEDALSAINGVSLLDKSAEEVRLMLAPEPSSGLKVQTVTVKHKRDASTSTYRLMGTTWVAEIAR